MADAPAPVVRGGALSSSADGFIYALRGGVTAEFWRYSVAGDSWQLLADTPDAIARGSALLSLSSTIYAVRGKPGSDLWRYSVTGIEP